MIAHIATMMKEGGLLALTVSTVMPNSNEEKWINSQKEASLKDFGLIYYDTIKRIRKAPILGRKDYASDGEIKLVSREECNLPDPGHKVEYVKETSPVGSIPAVIHTLRQGRYLHTLESIKPFLDPYFTIKDHKVMDENPKDPFLCLIAERKSS